MRRDGLLQIITVNYVIPEGVKLFHSQNVLREFYS
jgi:hypothetical protein